MTLIDYARKPYPLSLNKWAVIININLSHIEKVRGNSQGCRLQVKYPDKEIPVSGNYSRSFKLEPLSF